MTERTVFIQFEMRDWTASQLESLTETVGSALPEDTNAVFLPKEIEFLDREEIENLTEHLIEALND